MAWCNLINRRTNQPGKSGLRYELRFYNPLKSRHKKGAVITFCLGYDRSHNSLFVTVNFSNSKRLYISSLQNLLHFLKLP